MMSKKPIADKLRGSLNTKPHSVRSPITPLQTRSSGFTSAATTTTSSSCSSSSSGQVTITRKSVSGLAIPSAAVQSSKSSSSPSKVSTCVKSSKAESPSAASGNVRPSGATSDSTSSGKAKTSGKSTPAPIKIHPGGNLVPSGNVKITGMTQGDPKTATLGPGASTYGYGSVMPGISFEPSSSPKSMVLTPDAVTLWKKMLRSSNPEEVKRIGNDLYDNGFFTEALKLYDRAISLRPANAIYHSNRAAALSNLDRIGEAVNACEVAIKLDPTFVKAHHRLGALLFRLGQIDNAGRYFYMVKDPSDPMVLKKLQIAYNCIERCTDARRHGEWDKVLSEASEAMSSGADYSPQLGMCKVEALMKLQRLDDAQSLLAFVPKVEPFPATFSKTRFFHMTCEAYVLFVKSQIELALGRFENAVTAAEKASEIHPGNCEIGALYKKVRVIIMARDRGHNLYESERYSEARVAYTEGIAFDRFNAALLYHRADCYFKVGEWESSIEDCDPALQILPSYTKPRLLRAAAYCKLERWDKAVSDYEILRMEMPYDKEISESLFQAQVALKKSQGELVLNMEFGGKAEEISSVEELKAALTQLGVSVVYFFKTSDKECKEMSDFMDALCIRYTSLHFLKVEIEKCREVGDAENVKAVPTIKIYKVGSLIKEIVCPSKEALERSVRHYGL